MADKQQYSHRNGEAVPPEEQGHYWYEWEIPIDGTEKSSVDRYLFKVWADRNEPSQLYCQSWLSPDRPSPKIELMHGRWWGPVQMPVPPWSEVVNG